MPLKRVSLVSGCLRFRSLYLYLQRDTLHSMPGLFTTGLNVVRRICWSYTLPVFQFGVYIMLLISPNAPIIAGTTLDFTFHVCCIFTSWYCSVFSCIVVRPFFLTTNKELKLQLKHPPRKNLPDLNR